MMNTQFLKHLAKTNCDIILSQSDRGSSHLKSIYCDSDTNLSTALISYMALKTFVVCRAVVNSTPSDEEARILLDAILDEIDDNEITLPDGIKITSETLTAIADGFAQLDNSGAAKLIPSAFFDGIEADGTKIATRQDKIELFKILEQDTSGKVLLEKRASGTGCLAAVACMVLLIALLSILF